MGFWSTLANVGASLAGFIPGVGPLAAAGIKAGVGAVTGALDNKSSGPSTSAFNTSLDPEIKNLLDLSKSYKTPESPSVAAGKSTIQTGLDTLQPAKSYFTRLVGGDRNTLTELLGPEVSTVLAQYDNAAKTASEFGARGGGRTGIQAEAPFQKAGVYGKVLAGARPGAVDKLSNIGLIEGNLGKTQADIGLTEQSNADKLFATKLGILPSLLGGKTSAERLDFEKQQEKNKALSNLGSSLGSVLINLLQGRSKGSGGGGSSAWDLEG